MNTPTDRNSAGRLGYQNAVLTAIAVLLGVGLIERGAGTGSSLTEPAGAMAQEPQDGGLTNKLEQNKQIIAELRAINGRLERIEAKLAGRVDVRVTDMPPIKMAPEGRQKNDPKPDSKIEPKPADGGK